MNTDPGPGFVHGRAVQGVPSPARFRGGSGGSPPHAKAGAGWRLAPGAWHTLTRRGTGDLMGTLLRAPRRVLGPGRTGTPGSPTRPTHAGHTLAALATMDSSLHDQSVRGRQGPLVTPKSDS